MAAFAPGSICDIRTRRVGADAMTAAVSFEQGRFGFSTHEYRIRSIRVIDGNGFSTPLFNIGAARRTERTYLRFGQPFRLQVDYECVLPQLPDASCGVAAAFTRSSDMEHVMYFNTNYPHSDQEMQNYYGQEFRKYIGPRGMAEAYFARLQIRPDEYLLTVGIVPNLPSDHEFYELHYLQYPITVLSDGPGIPAAFYPNVNFKYKPLESSDDVGDLSINEENAQGNRIAAGQLPTPAMVRAGVLVMRKHLSSELSEAEEAVRAIYMAMRQSGG